MSKSNAATQGHLKARSRETYEQTYNNARDSAGSSRLPLGCYLFNESVAPISLIMPKFTEAPLVFRPFPAPNPEDPANSFEPGRTSTLPRGFSQWYVTVETCNFWGLKEQTQQLSWLLYHPNTSREDKYKNPARVFYSVASKAMERGSFGPNREWRGAWNQLFGKTGKISRPSTYTYMQGAVYANGSKPLLGATLEEPRSEPLGLAPADILNVAQVKHTAAESLLGLFTSEKPKYDPEAAQRDPAVQFINGDPVGRLQPDGSLKGGWIVTFYNPKITNFPDTIIVVKNGVKVKQSIKHRISFDGKISTTQGYEAMISRTWTFASGHERINYTVDLSPNQVKQIFSKAQYFYDDPHDDTNKGIFRFPSYEEQAVWIAQCFQPYAQLVRFALEESNYLTDDVNTILNAAHSVGGPVSEGEQGGTYTPPETPRARRGATTAVIDPTVAAARQQSRARQAAREPEPQPEDEYGVDTEVVDEVDPEQQNPFDDGVGEVNEFADDQGVEYTDEPLPEEVVEDGGEEEVVDEGGTDDFTEEANAEEAAPYEEDQDAPVGDVDEFADPAGEEVYDGDGSETEEQVDTDGLEELPAEEGDVFADEPVLSPVEAQKAIDAARKAAERGGQRTNAVAPQAPTPTKRTGSAQTAPAAKATSTKPTQTAKQSPAPAAKAQSRPTSAPPAKQTQTPAKSAAKPPQESKHVAPAGARAPAKTTPAQTGKATTGQKPGQKPQPPQSSGGTAKKK